jgi:GPI inositol-deacylase
MGFLSKVVTLVAFVVSVVVLFGPFVPSHASKNDCLMTHMRPSYKRVNTSSSSHYRLFLYKEDVTIPKEPIVARESGIPVLFIHGNAGSFKQVRSFGHEAYEGFYGMSEFDQNLLQHGMASSSLGEIMGLGDVEGNNLNSFDFWAVDLREELSGLSGALLEKQTEFVVDAVNTILHHYDKSFLPRVQRARSVVLVAHSMGGIVGLAAIGKLRTGAVASIVCLATPLHPVLLSDSTMARIYRDLAAARFDNVSITVIGGSVVVSIFFPSSQSPNQNRGSERHVCAFEFVATATLDAGLGLVCRFVEHLQVSR